MSLPNFRSFFVDSSEPYMKGENGHYYGFGRFTLDIDEQRLSDGKGNIPLTPKAFEVLCLLVQNAGHLVEKEELMQHVWPDSFVEESNVAKIVHTLRKSLGDDGNGNTFIETVPTRGYRFVANVEVFGEDADDTDGKVGGEENLESDSIGSHAGVRAAVPEVSNYARHYLLAGAIVVLGVVVTGFWISNGSLLPRPWAIRLSKHSQNSQAFTLVQDGRLHMRENRAQALESFKRAIELDPYYAEAYAGMAAAISGKTDSPITKDDLAIARQAVKKALTLDPDNVYGHTIQCRIMGTSDWEFEEAVTECRHAVELDPNDAEAHRELGFALNVVNRQSEALIEMKTAVDLSPTAFNKQAVGMILAMSGRYDDAIDVLKQIDETEPGAAENSWLVRCYTLKNDQSKAFEYFIKGLEQFGKASTDDVDAVRTAFASGGWPAAVPVATEIPPLKGTHSILMAILYTRIGEKDRAFEVLNALRQDRAIILVQVPRDPVFEPLHDDPRYQALLSDMHLN